MRMRSKHRRKRWFRFALAGVLPVLLGVLLLWDGIQRKDRLAKAPPRDPPVSLRRLPADQQVYYVEVLGSTCLIVSGVVGGLLVLILRRRH